MKVGSLAVSAMKADISAHSSQVHSAETVERERRKAEKSFMLGVSLGNDSPH